MCRCCEQQVLTPQQIRIACLLVTGMKPGQIARELNLRPQTVRNYMQDMGKRLRISGSMYDLAKELITRGYLVIKETGENRS